MFLGICKIPLNKYLWQKFVTKFLLGILKETYPTTEICAFTAIVQGIFKVQYKKMGFYIKELELKNVMTLCY
jgi:hypothetical protein